MLFYRLLYCPKINFGPLSIFAPWKGWRGTWKINFPVKNGFSVKKLFRPFWARKWWLPLALDVMEVYERLYICASLLADRRVIRNIPDSSFKFTESLLGKQYCLLKPYYVVLRLYPLIVLSSSRDYTLRFLRGIHNISGCYAFT